MKEANLKFTRFNNWVWKNLPACKEIVKLATASLDGKISWREWVVMKVHMYSCDSCINFLKQIKFIRQTLRHSPEKLPQEDTSIKLSDEARGRLKDVLSLESGRAE